MLTFYDFGAGGGGAPSGITLAVKGFDTDNASGTYSQDITTSMGGLTPKAIFMVSSRATGSGEVAPAGMGLGAVAGANQGGVGHRSRDNVGDTADISIRGTTQAFFVASVGSDGQAKAASASAITDGLRLSYDNNETGTYRASYMAFAGADTTAAVGTVNLGTGTSAISTNVGFAPDLVIFFGNGLTGATSGNTLFIHQWGGVLTSGVQRVSVLGENANQSAGRPLAHIFTDACVAKVEDVVSSLPAWRASGALTGTGFDLTPNANSNSSVTFYLALQFSGGGVSVVDFTTPTSTGSQTISGAGFTPRAAMVFLTNLEAVDTAAGSTTDLQSGYSVSLIGNEQWSTAIRIDSGADPTDTATQVANTALIGPSSTDCDAITASLTGFTSDGMTLNYSAVQGSGKKGFVLFIE